MPAVLVVDDDGAIRKLVAMLLKQHGHDVLLASNGLEGLMVYSSYRSKLDLVVTDIDMPQMNGIELANRIRARDPFKKILLMSGGVLDDQRRPANCPLLRKPFLPDQLIVAVEDLFKPS